MVRVTTEQALKDLRVKEGEIGLAHQRRASQYLRRRGFCVSSFTV